MVLENTRYHYPYTTNFCLNVLNLRHIDLATQEDQDNELVYLAQMFMAETWEALKRLSEHSAFWIISVPCMKMAYWIRRQNWSL